MKQFEFIDQLGRKISLEKAPQRLVSVVPSQTELLADLGLENEVFGITKFCVYPEKWFRNKTRIGGTKQLKIDKIIELKPDLIIANKEENDREQIETLAKYFPVWISDVKTLDDAQKMIFSIGKICKKEENAKVISEKIKLSFESLESDIKGNQILNGKEIQKTKAVYFIWRKPYMTVGGDTFINAMLEAAGFENLFQNEKRYPETNLQALKSLDPEVLLLSSEPFPFREKHIAEILEELPDVSVKIVDGELFSWYGSRLIYAADYFRKLRLGV